jgi:hypothetical protein
MVAEQVSHTGLLVSLLLPWLTGSIWVRWLLRRSSQWNWFIVLGQGFLLGILATSLLLVAWARLGVPLHFWWMSAVLCVLCLCGLAMFRLSPATAKPDSGAGAPAGRWAVAMTFLLLALICVRYWTMFQEILLRPLYPWDAWMSWAPKAIVWFSQGELTPFVSPPAWLASDPESGVYTLGARTAWRYPIVVPLVQLWGMLGAGAGNTTLIYIPWLLVAVSLGLSLFGYLRLAGASVLSATAGCYLLLNMPYLNVHTALAGYADIWVTAAFGSAVFALHAWERNGDRAQGLMALLLAALCTQMKIPGLIFGGIVFLVFLLTALRLLSRPGIYALVLILLALASLFLFGVDLELPGFGRLQLGLGGVVLPLVGSFKFSFHPVQEAMFTTLFIVTNWGLLWYLALLTLAWQLWRHRVARHSPVLLSSLAGGLLFVFFVYFFTDRYEFALDLTQVNRAFICLTPLLVLYVFSSLACEFPQTPEDATRETGARAMNG